MRQRYRIREGDVAPDAWARLVVDDRSIVFHAEMDEGSEGPARIQKKAAMYERQFAQLSERLQRANHVLWIAGDRWREESMRRALKGHRGVRHWTATKARLDELSHLGPVWDAVDEGAGAIALTALEGRPRDVGQYPIENSVGKTGWEDHRPGGGQ